VFQHQLSSSSSNKSKTFIEENTVHKLNWIFPFAYASLIFACLFLVCFAFLMWKWCCHRRYSNGFNSTSSLGGESSGTSGSISSKLLFCLKKRSYQRSFINGKKNILKKLLLLSIVLKKSRHHFLTTSSVFLLDDLRKIY
jgi:hypothetical protein